MGDILTQIDFLTKDSNTPKEQIDELLDKFKNLSNEFKGLQVTTVKDWKDILQLEIDGAKRKFYISKKEKYLIRGKTSYRDSSGKIHRTEEKYKLKMSLVEF